MRAPVFSVKQSIGALVLVTVLSGCASHYRGSLETYRTAEPTPFYQRTLEWTDSANEAVPGPEVQDLEPAELSPTQEPTPAPEIKSDEIAARVLGISVETYSQQRAELGNDATLGASLARGVTWRTLLITVARQNPDVRSAQAAWEATVRQYSQAEYLDGLLQEFKGFSRYLMLGVGMPIQKDDNNQIYPSPSLITLRGEIIREQVRLAELAWETALRDALVEAGIAFFDYQFEVQGAATVAENVKLLEDLVSVVQDRYATGLATQPDVLRLQAELERQRNLLIDFAARRRTSKAALNALMGRSANAPIGEPAHFSLPSDPSGVDALTNLALNQRQEFLAQEARVAQMELAIRMGEVMNRPLFSMGYSTFDRGMGAEAATGEPTEPFGVMPDASMPTPGYAQTEAYLAEMRSNLAGARAMLDEVRLSTEAMVVERLEAADIAERQMTLVERQILPLEQSTYDITLRAYTVAASSFTDLLDAERNLIATRLELDEHRRDRNKAILEIALVRGTLADVAP